MMECDRKVMGSAQDVKVEPVVGEKFSVLCLCSVRVTVGQVICR